MGNYPTALRAIPATVPSMFYVLCGLLLVFCVVCGPLPPTNDVKNLRQNQQKNDPKSSKNRSKSDEKSSKSRLGGVPEALGGGLGAILAPRGAPGAPGATKVTKIPFVPRSFPISGAPQNGPFFDLC